MIRDPPTYSKSPSPLDLYSLPENEGQRHLDAHELRFPHDSSSALTPSMKKTLERIGVKNDYS